MSNTIMRLSKIAVTAGAFLTFASQAQAVELIVNGGFETGDYSGWTRFEEPNFAGGLYIVANANGNSPLSNSDYVANPNGGEWFSITDQTGSGAYALTQSFTIARAGNVTVSFDMFANDWSGQGPVGGRDPGVGPTQNAVVDILFGGAAPFTENPADIAASLYGPGTDGPNPPYPWTSYSYDVFLAPGAYTIRFAESDNLLYFNQGVDNVSIDAVGVPEPATWAMMIGGLAVAGGAVRSRRRVLAVA